MMMGMEEDPEDHAAVAASVFIAVAVYAVSAFLRPRWQPIARAMLTSAGIFGLLRFPSLATCSSQSTRRDISINAIKRSRRRRADTEQRKAH